MDAGAEILIDKLIELTTNQTNTIKQLMENQKEIIDRLLLLEKKGGE